MRTRFKRKEVVILKKYHHQAWRPNPSNPSDLSYSSDSSISPPPCLPDNISFELFRVFSLPAPQISLELIFDGLRVTEVSPPPFPKGD